MMISDHADPTVTPGSRPAGGQNVYVGQLAGRLASAGVDVDVFTRRESDRAPVVVRPAPGVQVVRLQAGPPGFMERDRFLDVLPEFIDSLRHHVAAADHGGYDLIQSNYWYSGLAGLELRRSLGVPQVHMNCSFGRLRGLVPRRGSEALLGVRDLAERRIATTVEATVVASPWESRQVRAWFAPPAGSVHTIPIGVDPSVFRPLDRALARRRLDLPTGSPVVLYAGRPELRKGLATLAEAWPEIVRRHPSAVLVMAGPDLAALDGDPDLADIACLARDPGYRMVLSGPVPHDRMAWHYNAADVVVVPSYYEPFGIVAVEAMACGTPVVASMVGGLQDSVRDGVTGRLVGPRDPGALGRAVAEVLDAGRSGPDAACLDRVRRGFTWPEIVRRYLDLYRALVTASSSRPRVRHAADLRPGVGSAKGRSGTLGPSSGSGSAPLSTSRETPRQC
jgi:D-inositol-3-phosphate glycosyltransferase